MKTASLIPLQFAILILSACDDVQGIEQDRIGPGLKALKADNALDPNALNANALNANALSESALSTIQLSPNALDFDQLSESARSAIQAKGQDGELSRQLLEYTVSCALDTTQSLSFSWTDEVGVVHPETYWGLLALATSWATRPLASSDAEWVSACLASRVNWYGAKVTISSRGARPPLTKVDPSELGAYPNVEGAFWGNLFTEQPAVFACHYSPNDENSREHLRDCAAGHIDDGGNVQPCGIIQIAGACETICFQTRAGDGHYDSCGSAAKPITIFLP
jgi:hypothetical protein